MPNDKVLQCGQRITDEVCSNDDLGKPSNEGGTFERLKVSFQKSGLAKPDGWVVDTGDK